MLQLGAKCHFLFEPGGAYLTCDFGGQDFNDNLSAERHLGRDEQATHDSARKLPLKVVSIAQGVLEAVKKICHEFRAVQGTFYTNLASSPRLRTLLNLVERRDPPWPVRLALVVQRKDMRVLEFRGDIDLGQEPFGTDHSGEFRIQNFERHLPAVLEVIRQGRP